jgi:hypothetical protein
VATCSACRTENEPGTRFCINCGTRLPAETGPIQPEPSQPQYPPPAPEPQPGYMPPPTQGNPLDYGQQPIQPYETPAYPQTNQPNYAQNPPKDRGLALIFEILPGLFGLLGFGWIYSGNTNTGIIWLVGMLVWVVVAFFIILFTIGLGFFCVAPIHIALIAVSAYQLHTYTKAHPELFGP